MSKQAFIDIYQKNIKREGSKEFLDYLCSSKSDFFIAPASTRFHGNYEGGLVDHSIHVFECLKDYCSRNRVKERYGMDFSDEYKFNHNNYCSLGKIDLFCRNERKAVKRDRNVCKQRTVFLRSGTTSCGGEISAHQGEGPQHGTVHQGREGRDSARGRDSGPKGMHHTCENG